MRKASSVLFCSALSCLFLLSPRSARGQFIRGVALGSYSDIGKAKLEEKLDELKALGASHVSLVVSWSTQDVRSTKIAPRKRSTTPDHVLVRMVRRAHAKGLKVFLFPILDVRRRKPLEWRGRLKPRSWDAWWRSYSRFILHYAAIAARTKVKLFCVGSELVSTEKMRARWRSLIRRVRAIYRGRLVYSANWDHYKPVVFWDLVDVVGLTAYYQLSKDKDAPEEALTAEWIRIRDKLVAWSRRIQQPLLFTEVGYPSMDGCAVHPWDYTLSAPPDMEEQKRAIKAFIRAWDGVPQLAGVVIWDWYGKGGTHDTRYTVRGKPAEKVLRRWFYQVGSRQRSR